MLDVLAGIIGTVSTTLSLGYVGYAVASAAVVSGAIALCAVPAWAIGLPAVSALVGIGLFVVGFRKAIEVR